MGVYIYSYRFTWFGKLKIFIWDQCINDSKPMIYRLAWGGKVMNRDMGVLNQNQNNFIGIMKNTKKVKDTIQGIDGLNGDCNYRCHLVPYVS